MGTLKHYYKPPVGTHLRSFFSYYGGKHKIAKYYPEPKYQTIVEPFAGSAGYSLRYPRCKVICEQAGAKWLPFSPFRTVRSQGNSYGGWHSRQEVVWIKE